jgi:hypothetical protein
MFVPPYFLPDFSGSDQDVVVGWCGSGCRTVRTANSRVLFAISVSILLGSIGFYRIHTLRFTKLFLISRHLRF